MPEIEGFILLGGASSRMGTDKAKLSLDGKQFVERIAEQLASVATTVKVVGAAESASSFKWENVPDVFPNWGALGGLYSALAASQADWAAIVACDLPFVTGELFVRLASHRENFDAVIPVQADGRPQPLCGIYRPVKCAPIARELIEAGKRRPRDLLQKITTRWIKPEELSDIEGCADFFMNINTPEDFERAKRKLLEESSPGI
jgi:molybdopterin-guanine dinucleotide biosynthesis protein A